MSLRGGITGLFQGAPGTGKSHLLGSIMEVPGVTSALLLAPKPREINSYKYRVNGLTAGAEVFQDARWAPAIGAYEAGAFTRLYQRVLSLYDDDTFDAILVDPFTDVTYLAAHELLAVEKAETPRDLRDSIGFYGALKYRLKGFTQSLVGLASSTLKRPKHVFVSVHVQPAKEDTPLKGGGTKESQDSRAQGVEFMGDVLPMIEGGYRREIAGEFDIVGFTSVRHEMKKEDGKMSRVASYVVQLNADPERHAKAAIVPRLAAAEIPNNLPALFRVIEEASK